MSSEATLQDSSREEFLDEILAELSDPVHKRLIEAYRAGASVESMESELRKILLEVLQGEDAEDKD